MSSMATLVLRRTRRRGDRGTPGLVVAAALFCLSGFLLLAVTGTLLAPQSPTAQNAMDSALSPSSSHWFGTDVLGRDIFSRVVAGTRNSIVGPFLVACGTLLVALPLGLAAGYFGGWVDSVITRLADLLYALPSLLIAIVVVGLVASGYAITVAVLILLMFPNGVRIFRSLARVEAGLSYVDAARTLGLRPIVVMGRHVLPNIRATVATTFMLDFAVALVGFSSLAFLGLGVEPGGIDWGTTLSDGRELLFINPMAALGPALALVVLAASATLTGDWLQTVYSREVES